ncbi:MAG TPA: DoxX family protein [Rhizomicrobium sp.]|nr:DoxX family protein [Rhizomicrobium sp.]
MSETGSLLAHVLAALFGAGALLHLAAPGFVRRSYLRWDYPRGFYYVVGIAQGLTALFLAVEQTRIWGGILGAMILFVTVTALLNRRKYAYAVPAILVMVALAPAMA